MFAVVKIQGKQYKVEQGMSLKIDNLPEHKAGDKIEFKDVFLLSSGSETKLGSPFLSSSKVVATVQGHEKGDKVIVFKYKRRKNYKKKQGFKHSHSVISIDQIVG